MLAISVLLLVGVVAGYAAVSSPELRGPYATPRPLPSTVNAPGVTGATVWRIETASRGGPSVVCVEPRSARGPTAVVLGQTQVYDRLGQTMITTLPAAVGIACPVRGPGPVRDRIAP